MTNQSLESVIAEVIEYHADTIGTHYEGCYKHHAGCLAVRLRDMLREPGGPDAANERVAELEAELASRIEDRDYWYGIADKAASQRDAANEDRKQVEAEIRDLLRVDIPSLKAERDAATAALERVRVIHVRDTPSIGGDWCLDDHHKWPCPTVAALDGAPEPEVKP